MSASQRLFLPVGAQDIEDEEADVDGGGDFDDQHAASSTMVRPMGRFMVLLR